MATPDGTTCRFVETERPSLTLGLGVVDPPVLPGIYGYETAFPAEIADPQPVGGIVLRIPLGRSQQNCDALLKTEAAMNRLRKTQEMFENGLITEDQLKVVAGQTYAILSKP